MVGPEVVEVRGAREARMSRAQFVHLVSRALTAAGVVADGSGRRERLEAVAATMRHYPVCRWMDPVHGCGCVVGEYLAQFEGVPRSDLAYNWEDWEDRMHRWLYDAAIVIDALVRSKVGPLVGVVLIDDEKGAGDE